MGLKQFDIQELITKPFDKSNYVLFLKTLFGITPEIQELEISGPAKEYIKKGEYFGAYESNREKIHFYSVFLENKNVERARIFQRDFIAKQLENEGEENALVVFYTKDKWRLSLVKIDYFEEGEKIKKKRRTAKRFSFYIGEEEINNTCKQRIKILFNKEKISIKDIEDAFSVEKVTKEFFEKYTKLFNSLHEEVKRLRSTNKIINEEFENRNILEEDFAKKILGQIVFLYFLQKKGWLGIKRGFITKKFGKFGEGDKDFLFNLFKIAKRNKKNFFNDYLEKLFYDALANSSRKADDYKFELDGNEWKIPFLNGGLFEPIGEYDWGRTNIEIDNDIFRKIFETFNMYNFTVREDEPLEKEVAIDPEMLGKVFENLLNIKERKSTGSFYTPREIVHYMCQQSLINYLETNTCISKKVLEEFVTKDCSLELPEEIEENKMRIDNFLKEIKVVDPAVGSGAFLVGMMTEIVKARSCLKKEKKIFDLKKECIENNLHGVDISPGAVDICQLRLWLSLVVDEENYGDVKPLPNLDYKIMCGNSLIEDYKGMKLWNDKWLGIKEKKVDKTKELKIIDDKIRELKSEIPFLINKNEERKDIEKKIRKLEKEKKELMKSNGTNMKLSYSDSERKVKTLKSLHKKFTHISDRFEKQEKKKKIEKATIELIKAKLTEERNQEAFKELEEIMQKKRSMPFFLWKMNFIEVFQRENPGFDVVIANPPYIGQKGNKELFEIMKKDINFEKKMDYWYFFLYKAHKLNNSDGTTIFITPNYWITARGARILRKKIVNDFRFTEWINFNDNNIFEAGVHTNVFILKKSKEKNKEIKCTIYDKKYEDNFITNKDNQINFIIDQNIIYSKWTEFVHFLPGSILRIISKLINNSEKLCDTSTIGRRKEGVIAGKKLTDGICNLNQGLVTGKDRFIDKTKKINEGVFIINNEEKNRFDKSDLTRLKEFYKNSDIYQYHVSNIPKHYLIYVNDIDLEDELRKFPKVYNHLLKFKDILLKRSINGVLQSAYKKGKWWALTTDRPNINFNGDKILCPQRSRINAFGYSNSTWYAASDVFYISLNKKDYNLKYVCSILNCKLIYYWLFYMGKRKGNILELTLEPLQFIPIKEISPLEQTPFIERVDKILNITKDKDYLENQEKQNKIKEIEIEIDKMVYDLYELTPEEIKIVEGFGE